MSKKKKILIGVGVAVIVIIILLIVIAKFNNKPTYFNDVNKILSDDVGSFSYIIDVRTNKHDKSQKDSKSLSESELSELKNDNTVQEKEEETNSSEDSTKHQSSITDTWDSKDNVSVSDWKYPNYKLTISGQTTSVKPYKAYFKIDLVTEYFNDNLTEVYCDEGKNYINMEQLRYWLTHSKDAYFVKLGKSIPEGSKWLVINDKDFNYKSRYSEDNEKHYIRGMNNIVDRSKNIVKLLFNALSNNISSSDTKEESGMKYLIIDSPEAFGVAKELISNSSALFDSYLNTLSKDAKKEFSSEKDNVIKAISPLFESISCVSNPDISVRGQTRNYTNNAGNSVTEATFNTAVKTNKTDYRVNITLSRSGSLEELEIPSGSTIDYKDYKASNEGLVSNVFNKIIDYLNFTNIKTEMKLKPALTDLDTIIKDYYIDLINETGLVYITRSNFDDIISSYKNYDKDSKLESIVASYNALGLNK